MERAEQADPSHLQIVGPRYAGKTVLLHALAERMRADDSTFQLVWLWDLGHRTPESNDAFLALLCERVSERLRESASPYAGELQNLEPRLFSFPPLTPNPFMQFSCQA